MTKPRCCAIISPLSRTTPTTWGYSSVGRALEWHSRGQGFDSPYLHQKESTAYAVLFFLIDTADEMPCSSCQKVKKLYFTAPARCGGQLDADTERTQARGSAGVRLPASHAARSPPKQANPNCFVTTELFGFFFTLIILIDIEPPSLQSWNEGAVIYY